MTTRKVRGGTTRRYRTCYGNQVVGSLAPPSGGSRNANSTAVTPIAAKDSSHSCGLKRCCLSHFNSARTYQFHRVNIVDNASDRGCSNFTNRVTSNNCQSGATKCAGTQ